MHNNATEKSTGLLYGKHDTEVGHPLPRKMREKDGLPSWMMDKTWVSFYYCLFCLFIEARC